ncbi:unnamed protein product [Brassicogethes aeneus]|uniref:Spaetzle domain-containing protein n=1 Tax=Brassicogethes aeneus TaxID=1431903 RepID=A0A9P0BKW7_BRAAE|nr:unnamed protein product [Brassicogethes aeneus]
MSLLNYSVPFLATPHPPTTNYYHHSAANVRPLAPPLQPLAHQGPYSYPPPEKPFLEEEFGQRTFQNNLPKVPSGFQQNNYAQNNRNNLVPQPPQGGGQQHGGIQYTKVEDDGTKTNIHAVIDYDDYEDEEGDEGGQAYPPVTPIQGPIYVKNGSVPVVPLYSHPVLSNGSFVQIPILWTALSVALGYERSGEILRGVPCVKKNQQLMCPSPGPSYPLDRIELFIDENKALMKRMYGEFDMIPPPGPYPSGPGPETPSRKYKRATKPGVPDLHFDPESPTEKLRSARNFRSNQSNHYQETGRVDACDSKMEIKTPYWASNSAGKIRAIVNTQHFEQAIHQEVCSKSSTKRCAGDCGCEQKYKWHRLLAYDPDNDCKGIFMDWFLFPSCCVCRCDPNTPF